jgi:tetratricopeptide (TPR) repeat protein
MILGCEYGSLSPRELGEAAMPLLERALALDERLSSAHTAIGAVRSKSGDTEAAEAALRRAIELDPNDAVAFHWYADVLLLSRVQPEAALPLIRRALELDPLSPAVIATHGQVLEALGRFEEARSQYESILEIDAASPVGYFVVGDFERFVNGRLDEAVRWYRESIARDPGNSRVQGSISISYLELGDLQLAKYWMERAMAQGPDQYLPIVAGMLLGARLNRQSDSLSLASRLREILRLDGWSLMTNAYLGDYQTILDVCGDRYPELSCSSETRVSRRSIGQAVNLSLVRKIRGEQECAARLLEGVLEVTSSMPRLGSFGFGITDVEALAGLGRADAALAALRQAIDAGWRSTWGLPIELRPQLADLKTEPDFVAMVAEIEQDMSIQLARVREMELGGQLAAIPDP